MSYLIQERAWIPLLVSVVLAISAPAAGADLGRLVIPMLAFMFLVLCLKSDVRDVVSHIRRPRLIGYVLLVYLLIVPALLYVVVRLVDAEAAIAVLLLCSMPPGMAAPAFTDMVRGRTSLAMALTIVGVVVSPLTVFALFSLLTRRAIQLDVVELVVTLAALNLVPLAGAQALKRTRRLERFLEDIRPHYSTIIVLCVCFIIYVAVSQHVGAITASPLQTMADLAWLYAMFVALHLVGYFVAPSRSTSERAALAVSKAYMHNALAMGIAIAFFSPRVAFLMALSEVPWSTCIGPFKYVLNASSATSDPVSTLPCTPRCGAMRSLVCPGCRA